MIRILLSIFIGVILSIGALPLAQSQYSRTTLINRNRALLTPQTRTVNPARPSAVPRFQGTPINPQPQNLPIYNPYFSIYFGPLYEEYDEPCHWDEEYGQWVGPCQKSLTEPGYSITYPNQIR